MLSSIVRLVRVRLLIRGSGMLKLGVFVFIRKSVLMIKVIVLLMLSMLKFGIKVLVSISLVFRVSSVILV